MEPSTSSSDSSVDHCWGNLCECRDERCCLCRLFDNAIDDELANVPLTGLMPSGATVHKEFLCIRCETIPVGRIFQCHNGHLICEACYQVQVLDKMLCETLGTCPQCSVRMYRHLPNRNIAIEWLLAEMQLACEHCGTKMPRSALRSHFRGECPGRLVYCKYRRIGCPWYGRRAEASAHDAACAWPSKTGAELMELLLPIQAERDARTRVLQQIQSMVQLPNLTVRLVQVLPQGRIRKFPQNQFVAVSNLRAHAQQWSLLLKWQTPAADDDNPQAMGSLHLCLQLDPPEDWSAKLLVSYTLVHGTHSEVFFRPNYCERFEFSSNQLRGPPALVYRHTMANCKKLLLERGIYVRLLIAHIKP
ncbi:cysteine and histidine-rich protein 1-like [Drosophila obscura]|uniref:cysteine and histidine-rich protein 1-like n=1 Tax=Drosophila obscura TaxID=7282 RepID=UPI001BB2C2E4|nr:cysteine and histidine-rich protein 1-like [Drosophila obscura]